MTTFEITIIVLLVAIVVLLIVLLRTAIGGFHKTWHRQQCLYDLLDNADDANRKFYLTLNGYLSDLANNSKGHYNELQQLREEICSKRLLLSLDTKPFPPCYAPDGVCMNPHGDCINCPKRGTGGTWSTDILTKAENAALQERFNDNKED